MTSSRTHLSLRFLAFVVFFAGAVFFVPSVPVTLSWTLLGCVKAGEDISERHFGAAVLRLVGVGLFVAAILYGVYLCYGFARYALHRSELRRGPSVWAGASVLSGVGAFVIAGFGIFYRDAYAFQEVLGPAGFALLAGVCW